MPAKINSKIKKILLVLSSLVLLFTSMAQPLVPMVHAQSTWYNQNPADWYLKVYSPTISGPSEIFGERYTAAQVQWIFWSLGSTIINAMMLGHTEVLTCIISKNLATCFGDIKSAFEDVKKSFEPITSSSTTSTIASVVGTNPISGIAYTKRLISKFNPVSSVNAQGFGFTTGANSIIKLWQISRNFAFSLLIVAVIVMAFMIMFRVKISPQIVITVQSSIPKLITALILITFSYAIAGFMIDLMYVVIGLIATLISSAGLSSYTNPMDLFREFTTGENAIGLLFEFWFAFMVTALWSIASSFNPVTWIGGILIFIFSVFFIIVAIISTFKIITLIFKNFVHIVLTIVTGPIEILLGTFTQGSGFGSWLKKLLSYLAVYPVMALLFFLAFFFLAQSLNVGLVGSISELLGVDFVTIFPFNPAMHIIEGTAWDPPLSTWVVSGDAILWAIVAYVIITLVPKTVEIVQGFISGKPFAYGSAVGEATGALTTFGRGGVSAGVHIREEARKRTAFSASAPYDPHWTTKTLQTLGIIK